MSSVERINISSVNVSKDVFIELEDNGRGVLLKTFDILKELCHGLFLQDDDSDEYWCIDETINGLRDILSSACVFVKGY